MLEALSRESGNRICVTFVFFRYSDHQVTVRDVLEILVNQTLERHPDCRPLVVVVYARHVQERTHPTEAELLGLLHKLSGRMSASFIVLDALDEAPVGIRLDLLRKLSSLPGVRLFITSRPLQVLAAKFPGSYAFSIAAQDEDLDLHIAQKIDASESLQDLLSDCDPALLAQISEKVKSKCGGMCV
jgi:ankyrin repeat domain-containing protein 50